MRSVDLQFMRTSQYCVFLCSGVHGCLEVLNGLQGFCDFAENVPTLFSFCDEVPMLAPVRSSLQQRAERSLGPSLSEESRTLLLPKNSSFNRSAVKLDPVS